MSALAMDAPPIVIGTRASRLALAQAELVRAAFEGLGRSARFEVIETEGDRRPIDTAWGEGAFVAAIERALLERQIDVAVHSAKDIPTDERPELAIGAYLSRADPRDALVVRRGSPWRCLDDLPDGTRVGTDSPRRAAFARHHRPGLDVHPLHGNVDTRLRRLDGGETDALILACAGLDRIGEGGRIVERLDPEAMPPAPGQGAIAIQIRRDDRRLGDLLEPLDHRPTRVAVEAERAFLAGCGGGCRDPIGALAVVDGKALDLLGGRAGSGGDGRPIVGRRHGTVDAASELAADLARELGAALDARVGLATPAAPVSGGRDAAGSGRVLVTRAEDQQAELVAALRSVGLEPVAVPTIDVGPASDERLDAAVSAIDRHDWVVVTSVNGARAALRAAARTSTSLADVRWAALGRSTAKLLEGADQHVAFRPSRPDVRTLAAELPLQPGRRVLVVRADIAGNALAVGLRARGAIVTDIVGYRTIVAPPSSRAVLRDAVATGPLDAVLFTSGSTVRGLLGLADAIDLRVADLPAVCIGRSTAATAREAGFRVVGVADATEVGALAVAAAAAIRGGGSVDA
jgi:hydroxymethylbilane synthase